MGNGTDQTKYEDKTDLQEDCDSKQEIKISKNVDGGWGWLVVAASFSVICVLDGIGYSFGVFLDPLLSELETGRGALSMAGSLQVGVYSMSGPAVAKVVFLWGERKACIIGSIVAAVGLLGASFAVGIKTLILCYSVITGMGFGLMYLPSIVIVSQHFTARRALATGIVLCAAGAGTFLFAPLIEQLVEQLKWRGAMRVLSGTCLSCVLCGAAMIPGEAGKDDENSDINSSDATNIPDKDERHCLAKILGEDLASSPAIPVLFLLIAADCLSALSLYIPYTHLPPAATAMGISPANAAFLISAIGITNTVGRLVAGWLADTPCVNSLVLITVSIIMATPTHYIFSVISSYWIFLILSCIFGFLTGMWVSAIPSALVGLVGVPLLAPSFGLLTAFRGIMVLSGPPMAGAVVDMVGVKGAAMIVSGIAMTVASGFYILSTLANQRLEVRRQYHSL